MDSLFAGLSTIIHIYIHTNIIFVLLYYLGIGGHKMRIENSILNTRDVLWNKTQSEGIMTPLDAATVRT